MKAELVFAFSDEQAMALDEQAQELIRQHKMPSLKTLLQAVAEVREKYRPQILAARKERDRG